MARKASSVSNRKNSLPELKDLRSYSIYALWPQQYSAITSYRIDKPLSTLQKTRGIKYILDRGWKLDADRAKLLGAVDFHWYHLLVSQDIIDLAVLPPDERPLVIFGADDYIEYCHPLNPSYARLGIRDANGELLKPGMDIYMGDVCVWADGESKGHVTFDIADNYVFHDRHLGIANEADGVVVTTEQLAKVYRDYGSQNVFVYPNSIDFDDYPNVELRDHDEVRILWCGGSSHYIDWYPVRDALVRVLNKYDNVKFIMWGQIFPWVVKGLTDPRKVQSLEWVPNEAYTTRLSTIGHDINLCLLTANTFNECKSAIKWYESSAISRPAVTLAANFGPYKEISDWETGVLYNNTDEFEDRLSCLIEDAQMRNTLAKNAHEWVRENRDIRKTTVPLYKWLEETYAKSGKTSRAG